LTQIGLATPIPAAHTLTTLSSYDEWWTYLLEESPSRQSLSTSEAELFAASQARQEALYLHETLKDFGYQQLNATEIYEDWPVL